MCASRYPGSRGPKAVRDKTFDPRAEILAYLRTHPNAADSLDGIVDWWLARQRNGTGTEAIQEALTELVGLGILETVTLGNGKSLYRLATPSDTPR
jgi:Fe2+ or Zn2+ uptake regulation protein